MREATSAAGAVVPIDFTLSGDWADQPRVVGACAISDVYVDSVWEFHRLDFLGVSSGPYFHGFEPLAVGTYHGTCLWAPYTLFNGFNYKLHRFTITVTDPAPAITVSDDLTVEAVSAAGAPVTFVASATDVIDGTLPVTCVGPGDVPVSSGDLFALGTVTVSCSAVNSRSVPVTDTFQVTVADTTAPTLIITSPPFDAETGTYLLDLVAVDANGAAGDYEASATDTVDPSPRLLCGRASGEVASIGNGSFTCHARDAAGNDSPQVWFAVRVSAPLPTITVPDLLVAEATGPDGAPADFAVTATDFTGSPLASTCRIAGGLGSEVAPGDTFPLGSTQVTCRTEDEWGGHVSDSFTVVVQDTTAPTITVPDDITVEAAGGAAVEFEATAFDLVNGEVPVTCDPASGSTFGVGTTTVTCTAVDPAPPLLTRMLARGSTSASFTVTVVEPVVEPVALPGDKPDGSVVTTTVAAGLPSTGAPALFGPLSLGFGLLAAGAALLRRRRA